MSDYKTLEEIAINAEPDGIAYALTYGGYVKPEDFEDEELRTAATVVRDALLKLDRALEDYYA